MNKILMVVAASALALTGLSSAQQAPAVVRTVTTTTTTRMVPNAPMQRQVVTRQVTNQPQRRFRQCRRIVRFTPNGHRVVRVKCHHGNGWGN